MFDRNLECNLAYIKSSFGILLEYIIHYESSDRLLADSIQIVTSFQNKIQQIRNEKGKVIKFKLRKVLEQNTGFDTICTIYKILNDTNIKRAFVIKANKVPINKYI